MKKLISYIQLIALIMGYSCLTCCEDQTNENSSSSLTFKAFSPTVVMEGAEMSIMGNQLDKINSIVFPGNIQVTNFTLQSSTQINLTIPAGIPVEGGHLLLKSENETLTSKVPMRVACPSIKSLFPGDEVGINNELTIKGQDLEYTKQIVFPAEDDKEITVDAINFLRKAPEDIKIIVPKNTKTGENIIKLIAVNGKETLSPPIKISTSAASGKMETGVYYTIWESVEDGLQFPDGWSVSMENKFQSDYFRYIEKEGYEFKIYFTYTATKAGGVGIQRENYTSDCVYYAEADNTKFGQRVERQESRDPKPEHTELQTCTTKGPDYATIMGGNEIILHKIEILFGKIPGQ